MNEKYTQVLVTKLSPSVHRQFKQIAKNNRRTLSSQCRILIEDYITELNEGANIGRKFNEKVK